MPSFNDHDLAERDAMINASMYIRIGHLANDFGAAGQAARQESAQLFRSRIINVPAHRVRIEQAPQGIPEPLAATLGNISEYSRAQTTHQDQAQGYQSRFREDFETSASQEEIRRLSYREIPDSQEYDSLSSNGWYPAGEQPWDSEFDSELEETAEDVVDAPRGIQHVSQSISVSFPATIVSSIFSNKCPGSNPCSSDRHIRFMPVVLIIPLNLWQVPQKPDTFL